MSNSKQAEWVLRVAVAGEFVGHGVLAILGNAQWVGWIQKFGVHDVGAATKLLLLIGLADLLTALIVLVKPVRGLLLWMAIWGFWTALLRPIVGMAIWDFIERWANWGAPLALLLIMGWPKSFREWWR